VSAGRRCRVLVQEGQQPLPGVGRCGSVPVFAHMVQFEEPVWLAGVDNDLVGNTSAGHVLVLKTKSAPAAEPLTRGGNGGRASLP